MRENLRRIRSDKFDNLVNTSVNQTLARTLITSGTTSFAVLALYLFGGEVLRGFAFTMLVGVISGTYSTIFIASSVAIAITKGRAARRSRQISVKQRAARLNVARTEGTASPKGISLAFETTEPKGARVPDRVRC